MGLVGTHFSLVTIPLNKLHFLMFKMAFPWGV